MHLKFERRFAWCVSWIGVGKSSLREILILRALFRDA
jgi:hypothetical protein